MKSPLIKNSLIFILFFFSTNLFSQSYEDLKKDIINFSSIKSDLNLDGKPDVIFYNKWLEGNSMYFFINSKNKYKLSLKTINFNLDGLYKIEKLEPVPNNNDRVILKIHTLSADKEDIKAIHSMVYKNNKWYLYKTEYNAIIFDPLKDKLVRYKCLYEQNIVLSEEVNYKIFNPSDKNCKKY